MIEPPRAILGLGNPGPAYKHNRHTIGFVIVDALGARHNASWHERDDMLIAKITIHATPVILIKPQAFMNNSGNVIPYVTKQGIEPKNILVVHDELELPFGDVALKFGGSAKGHNGLKSIIQVIGDQFSRLRFGIGRPDRREDVPNYVLQNFNEDPQQLEKLVDQAVELIESLYS